MLILVSGPSGVGKNTVIDELKRRHKNLEFMKTCTTRESRAQNDGAYFHVSKQEFEKMIRQGKLFEYENVHADIFYGTPFSSLEKVIAGDKDYIKDIDVRGVEKIVREIGPKAKVVTVFLDCPNAELEKRLVLRGEQPDLIQKRLSRARMERSYKKNYDLRLVNKNIEQTADKIENIAQLKK